MSELIQLLQLAQEGTLSTKVDNLIAVAQAHDAEIQQLREQVAGLAKIGQQSALTDLIFVWICLGIFAATVIFFGVQMSKITKRIAALEAPKS